MAMNVYNERLIIDLPNSEAVVEAQLKGIQDRDVTGYYTNDNLEKKQAIIDFFDNFESEEYWTDSEKIKEFKMDVESKILAHKELFKYNLDKFSEIAEYFSRVDLKIKPLFLGGESGRYLKFDNEDPVCKDLRRLFLGDVSNIIIEKRNSKFYIYPNLKENFYKKLFNKNKVHSIEELASILDGYYAAFETKKTGIHFFGIDYCVELNSFKESELIEIINNTKNIHGKTSYTVEIVNGIKIGLELLKDKNVFQNNACKSHDKVGKNVIYYGIPGCGKSYQIEHNVLEGVDKKENVFRTTFYLDYSNSDFIGQIYPKVKDGNVTYESVPGPFTKALKRAFEVKKDNEMVYLIIEEINRGNAAAIFGDTFQLLDRLKDDYDGRVRGDSEYPISNEFIENYLGNLVQKGQVYIPNNLTILATMNTSDQNVFPLDTAFKRRWDMEKVVSNWEDCGLAKMCVPFTDFTWKQFATTINTRMIEDNEHGEIIISEDKKLGAYFATEDMLVDKEHRHEDTPENRNKLKKFISKVVDYLFNDVTKFDHNTLFKEKITFDDIYNQFFEHDYSKQDVEFFHNVFKDKVEPDVIDE